jgi:dihydrofolate reductase/thymidylate synthase
MKKFNVILATDLNGGFGLNNKLPWDLPIDFEFFKSITKHNTILPGINDEPNILIMGRKTWESMDCKPLFKRHSFVITSNFNKLNQKKLSNTIFFPDFISAYTEASHRVNSSVWVIGGKQIYDAALRHWACDKIYWTLIKGQFDADTFIHMKDYPIIWQSIIPKKDINKNDSKEYELDFHEGIINHNIEMQYLSTLYDVVISGRQRETRNGITQSKFMKTLTCDLADGFPLLTTKKMFWKGIVEELLFFIRGDTDSTKLSSKGVKIWEPNTSREFLDSLGLDYPVGEMGPMYGYQWRHFNKPYPNSDEQGIDQLKKIIEEIKSDPTSRRIIMTDFNPQQVNQGVLYPCHSIVIQFYVDCNRLNCSMYQRSGDFFLGIPFNIASTSLLLTIIAQLTGLEPGKVHLLIGDYHIYWSHLDAVNEQLKRTPKNLPKLEMKLFKTLEEVENASLDDFKISGYECDPAIKANMVA